jgi:hypothetical protein
MIVSINGRSEPEQPRESHRCAANRPGLLQRVARKARPPSTATSRSGAILAEADFGLLVMRLVLSHRDPSGGFERPESAGAAEAEKLPASRKPLKYKSICHETGK